MPETVIITDNFNAEVDKIKDKKRKYRSLLTLFSMSNKILMIINFGTLLFCIVIPNSNIGLILSIYTLSFSVICNTTSHVPNLEKLIAIYEDSIIPQVETYARKVESNDEDDDNTDIIEYVQNIEKYNIKDYMGKAFVLVNTLRHIQYYKIYICAITYILTFICIPIIYHYSPLSSPS